MRTNIIVVDDFLTNPDETREFVLQQEFTESGNYPGMRSKPFENESVISTIASILEPHAGSITDVYGQQFQLTTCEMKSWVHADIHNDWAGVLYLTPDAPPSGGTGFYRHKETQLDTNPSDPTLSDIVSADGSDYTKWDLIESVANKYNRLVLYRGDMYHSSLDYFGQNMETGRLFQVFFISTEQ